MDVINGRTAYSELERNFFAWQTFRQELTNRDYILTGKFGVIVVFASRLRWQFCTWHTAFSIASNSRDRLRTKPKLVSDDILTNTLFEQLANFYNLGICDLSRVVLLAFGDMAAAPSFSKHIDGVANIVFLGHVLQVAKMIIAGIAIDMIHVKRGFTYKRGCYKAMNFAAFRTTIDSYLADEIAFGANLRFQEMGSFTLRLSTSTRIASHAAMIRNFVKAICARYFAPLFLSVWGWSREETKMKLHGNSPFCAKPRGVTSAAWVPLLGNHSCNYTTGGY